MEKKLLFKFNFPNAFASSNVLLKGIERYFNSWAPSSANDPPLLIYHNIHFHSLNENSIGAFFTYVTSELCGKYERINERKMWRWEVREIVFSWRWWQNTDSSSVNMSWGVYWIIRASNDDISTSVEEKESATHRRLLNQLHLERDDSLDAPSKHFRPTHTWFNLQNNSTLQLKKRWKQHLKMLRPRQSFRFNYCSLSRGKLL